MGLGFRVSDLGFWAGEWKRKKGLGFGDFAAGAFRHASSYPLIARNGRMDQGLGVLILVEDKGTLIGDGNGN